MPMIACSKCGKQMNVLNSEVGKEIVCPDCMTAQEVPAGARTVAWPRPVPRRAEDGDAGAPQHVIAGLTAYAMIGVGGVIIVVGLIIFFADHDSTLFAWGTLLSGLTTFAIGHILNLVRQIARQTYKADA